MAYSIKSKSSFAKDCILSALIVLTKEKPLHSINVSELCQTAGVSRMSFYRNYESVDDIITQNLNNFFVSYNKQEHEKRSPHALLTPRDYVEHYFDYLYSHRGFIEMLTKIGADTTFLDKQNEFIFNKYKNKNDRYSMIAYAGSIYNLYRLWASSNYNLDKSELISSLLDTYNIKMD